MQQKYSGQLKPTEDEDLKLERRISKHDQNDDGIIRSKKRQGKTSTLLKERKLRENVRGQTKRCKGRKQEGEREAKRVREREKSTFYEKSTASIFFLPLATLPYVLVLFPVDFRG